MRRFAISLLLFASAAFGSDAQDTTRFAAHLRAVRGQKLLTNAEYRTIRDEYLEWLDLRIKAGHSTGSINRELQSAGLFPRLPKATDEPDALDDVYASHIGYVGGISIRPIRSRNDIVAIEASMYKGTGCCLDVTALLYQRRPMQRLAVLNADTGESQYAYYLSSIAIGDAGLKGARLIASGWVISNCTSTWNGKRIRIDARGAFSTLEILVRDLDAKDTDQGPSVSSEIARDVVTFRYNGGTGDGYLLSGPSVARYHVVANRAVLEAPVALTRAAFIHEWLSMSDADAARWSEPEAIAAKSSTSENLSHGFEWERIARCNGSPPVWEIAVRANESKVLQVFRIAGSRATQLRMLAVSNAVTPSCLPDDPSVGLAGVAAELPW